MYIKFAIIAVGLSWATVFGANKSLSNQALVEKLLIADMDSVVTPVMETSHISAVKFNFQNLEPNKKIFLKHLFNNLFERYNIELTRAEALTELTVLNFDVEITYKEHTKALLGLRATWERILNYRLKGMIEGNGKKSFIKSLDFQKTYSDNVANDQIEELQNTGFKFLKGKLVEPSPWTVVFEPLVIISSVSAIVYLFFSMRS